MKTDRLNEVLNAARAAIAGKDEYGEYTICIGEGAKSYTNEVATCVSPAAKAAQIIKAAIGEVMAPYFDRTGEVDDVAMVALEGFARDNKIGYLCGVKS